MLQVRARFYSSMVLLLKFILNLTMVRGPFHNLNKFYLYAFPFYKQPRKLRSLQKITFQYFNNMVTIYDVMVLFSFLHFDTYI